LFQTTTLYGTAFVMRPGGVSLRKKNTPRYSRSRKIAWWRGTLEQKLMCITAIAALLLALGRPKRWPPQLGNREPMGCLMEESGETNDTIRRACRKPSSASCFPARTKHGACVRGCRQSKTSALLQRHCRHHQISPVSSSGRGCPMFRVDPVLCSALGRLKARVSVARQRWPVQTHY
jgi:hypothetical protein